MNENEILINNKNLRIFSISQAILEGNKKVLYLGYDYIEMKEYVFKHYRDKYYEDGNPRDFIWHNLKKEIKIVDTTITFGLLEVRHNERNYDIIIKENFNTINPNKMSEIKEQFEKAINDHNSRLAEQQEQLKQLENICRVPGCCNEENCCENPTKKKTTLILDLCKPDERWVEFDDVNGKDVKMVSFQMNDIYVEMPKKRWKALKREQKWFDAQYEFENSEHPLGI